MIICKASLISGLKGGSSGLVAENPLFMGGVGTEIFNIAPSTGNLDLFVINFPEEVIMNLSVFSSKHSLI